MTAKTYVEVHQEVRLDKETTEGWSGGWQLCFQWCTYHFADSEPLDGYRFIWRRPDGGLHAAMGQARLPSADRILQLLRKAADAGWLGVVEKNGKPINIPLP